MPVRPSIAVVAVALACASVPAAASASTISGRVAGAPLPKAGKGMTTVRAVRAKDLVIADVDKVRAGRYRLAVPSGSYWVFGATTRFRGKAGVDREVGKVRVRAGQRKNVRVSLRRRKRARTPRIPGLPRLPIPPTARAAFVSVKHPAVWVQHFAVSGPSEWSGLRKGMADLLITDLVATLGPACDGVVVEREKLDWILAEQLLSQSPAADPSTRIPGGNIIAHNREVTGTLRADGQSATLTVVVKNVVSGATRTVTRSAAADRILELEQSVVQEVTRLICGDKPPGHYTGQASGSMSGADGSSSQTLAWNGTVSLVHTGDLVAERGNDPPGEYALYVPESGDIHVTLDGVDGECAYHGETNVAIVPAPGEQSSVQQGVDEPTYSLIASFPDGAALPYTTTGPEHCNGGSSGLYPLAGRVFLGTSTGSSERSSSSSLAGSATYPLGPTSIRWEWSLAPQAG